MTTVAHAFARARFDAAKRRYDAARDCLRPGSCSELRALVEDLREDLQRAEAALRELEAARP